MKVWSVLTVLAWMLTCLSGCASTLERMSDAHRIAGLSAEQLAAENDLAIIESFHRTGAPHVRDEIKKRKLIRDDRWDDVYNNRVARGMTEMEVRASIGPPEQVNTSVNALGEQRQLCYFPDKYGFYRTYIYIWNGTVSSWQDSGR